MCGSEKELGMLALKAPDNSPSKIRTATVKETEGGKGREKGRGVLTTDTMLNATSIELVCIRHTSFIGCYIHVHASVYMKYHILRLQ